MRRINLGILRVMLTALLLTIGLAVMSLPAFADSAAEIDAQVKVAMDKLYAGSPEALEFSKTAKAILVFPDVVKAGLGVGGQFGEGALLVNGETIDYYNTVAASYGLQAGVQTFGYAMFMMNDKTLNYLKDSNGWEFGSGPTIVVVDKGASGSFTTSSAKDNIYVFFFDQSGLMAGLGLQGTKVTKINP
jgi:lipid-binding SYLF domain-containing protein